MNELTKIALLGTAKASRQSLDASTALGGAWDALGVERENELLLRSGADATMRLAGAVTTAGIDLPNAAPPDDLPVCSERVANLIASFIKPPRPAMLFEVFGLLTARNRRLPDTLLPAVLDYDDAAVRAAALPLLGERGRWLSERNPAWSWVRQGTTEQLPADAHDIWLEGDSTARLWVLRLCRMERPDEARAWIDEVWHEEKAAFRTSIIDTMRYNLTPDDEPLLERALDDRSSNVREVAAGWLATLPRSAYVARMVERADAFVQYTPPAAGNRLQRFVRSVTAQGTHGTIAVTLPATLEASWKRDATNDTAPRGIGKGTWMLMQILAAVPPAHWEERWQATPDDIVRAAQADAEHGRMLLAAWGRAAIGFRAARWATPLLDAWVKETREDMYFVRVRPEMFHGLLGILPPDQVRDFALRQLERPAMDSDLLDPLVQAAPRPWTTRLGAAFLDRACTLFQNTSNHTAYEPVEVAMTLLPEGLIAEAIERLGSLNDTTQSWQLRTIIETLETRRRIYREIDQ